MKVPGQVFFLAFMLAGLAQSQENDNFDVSLFRSINNQQNPGQDGFFEYLDDTSLPTFGLVPGGFFLVGAFQGEKSVADVGVLSLGGQLAALGLTAVLKWSTDRPRPFQSLVDVKVKHFSSAPWPSFPSGHTAQAFAIATILSLSYSKLAVTVPLFLWAGLVGYGRVYLGLHYPTDVFGGILTGVGSSFVIWGLRHHFHKLTKGVFSEKNQAIPVQSLGGSVPRFEFVKLAFPL